MPGSPEKQIHEMGLNLRIGDGGMAFGDRLLAVGDRLTGGCDRVIGPEQRRPEADVEARVRRQGGAAGGLQIAGIEDEEGERLEQAGRLGHPLRTMELVSQTLLRGPGRDGGPAGPMPLDVALMITRPHPGETFGGHRKRVQDALVRAAEAETAGGTDPSG